MTLFAALILAASPAASLASNAPECAPARPVAAMEPGGQVRCAYDRPERRAGAPVRLNPALFAHGDAGGVGRAPLTLTYPRQRLVIVARSHAPRSAGAEAARRGLARPSRD